MGRKKVLIVGNGKSTYMRASKGFAQLGHMVRTVSDGVLALKEIQADHYDLVLADLEDLAPQMSGLDLLKRIKKISALTPVILLSAEAGVKEAVEAMKNGAYDFIVKPLTPEMIKAMNRELFDSSRSKPRQQRKPRLTIITKNQKMKNLLRDAKEIADSRASVLIQGESGTGKELFARYIHHCSNRRNRPFVAINCAALPETLLESELFGYEKGSFTGAVAKKKGKFEVANHGTLLLDEVSEMDIQLQSKLLRVLQENEIDRIGGINPVPVDVRVIATTNRNLEQQIENGKFREDLFYRLNVVPFLLPPLRERKEDIPLLANYFIEKYNEEDHRSVKGLTQEAVQLLMQASWKGNVRELENIIERAILMCRGGWIGEKDLLISEKPLRNENPGCLSTPTLSLKEMEKTAIFRALDKTNGNRTHAAEILGISVRTLRNKLNEYKKKMECAYMTDTEKDPYGKPPLAINREASGR